jgi:hypothetical protein
VLISAVSMNRTGWILSKEVNPLSLASLRYIGLSVNNPSSAGSILSSRTETQPGWVKSPVPMTPIPLSRPQRSRFSGVSYLEVAREKDE